MGHAARKSNLENPTGVSDFRFGNAPVAGRKRRELLLATGNTDSESLKAPADRPENGKLKFDDRQTNGKGWIA